MLNQQSLFLGMLVATTAALLTAGCKSSGNGPAPQPTPPSAAVPVVRTIDGHTEGKATDDDGDHCFRQDSTRDLVLTVTAPEITKDNQPTAHLIDINNGLVKDRGDVSFVKDGTATITYHGHAEDHDHAANLKSASPLMLPQHLGSGPYVAVAQMTQPAAPGPKKLAAGLQPILLAYPYVTYEKDAQKECPLAGSQR
jgi:hypothetical protein